jgi:hypothetical protein
MVRLPVDSLQGVCRELGGHHNAARPAIHLGGSFRPLAVAGHVPRGRPLGFSKVGAISAFSEALEPIGRQHRRDNAAMAKLGVGCGGCPLSLVSL